MEKRFGISVYFGGEKPVYVEGDSTLLHKLKHEEWVQVGETHIKTSNINYLFVTDIGERQSAATDEDIEEIINWL